MRQILTSRRDAILTVAAGVFAPLTLAQESWPTRPIRVVNGYPPGGQTDAFAFAYGEYVSQKTGQPWNLEFKAGAGGSLAAAEVKRAAPDGHTLLFTTGSTLFINRAVSLTIPIRISPSFR